MIRITPTKLEAWRKFTALSWYTESMLRDALIGACPESPGIMLGRAWHSVLEAPQSHYTGHGYEAGGYAFARDGVQMALDQLPVDRIAEVSRSVRLDTPSGPCILSGRCDLLGGIVCWEIKSSVNRFASSDYLDSAQGLAYLHIFEADVVRFMLCRLHAADGMPVTVRSITHIAAHRHARGLRLLASLAGGLLAYISDCGIASTPALQSREQSYPCDF